MSEIIYDRMAEALNEYYIGHSKLIGRLLHDIPEEYHGEMLMRMQESNSVYGSKYESYLHGEKKYRVRQNLHNVELGIGLCQGQVFTESEYVKMCDQYRDDIVLSLYFDVIEVDGDVTL